MPTRTHQRRLEYLSACINRMASDLRLLTETNRHQRAIWQLMPHGPVITCVGRCESAQTTDARLTAKKSIDGHLALHLKRSRSRGVWKEQVPGILRADRRHHPAPASSGTSAVARARSSRNASSSKTASLSSSRQRSAAARTASSTPTRCVNCRSKEAADTPSGDASACSRSWIHYFGNGGPPFPQSPRLQRFLPPQWIV